MSRQLIRNLLFARKSALDGRTVCASVECYSLDHAIQRLKEKWPHVESSEWDYLDELAPDEQCGGGIGTHLPLHENSIATLVRNIYH
jgi:hypothetical protein